MILNENQYVAIATAFAGLNKVGGRLLVEMQEGRNLIVVRERSGGEVVVTSKVYGKVVDFETYVNQSAWVDAYEVK